MEIKRVDLHTQAMKVIRPCQQTMYRKHTLELETLRELKEEDDNNWIIYPGIVMHLVSVGISEKKLPATAYIIALQYILNFEARNEILRGYSGYLLESLNDFLKSDLTLTHSELWRVFPFLLIEYLCIS